MILCSVGHSSLRKHYGILEQVWASCQGMCPRS
jgi:hypothetical protein